MDCGRVTGNTSITAFNLRISGICGIMADDTAGAERRHHKMARLSSKCLRLKDWRHSRLLVPERQDWVHSSCPPRREEACCPRYCRKQQSHCYKGNRVGW